jgi:hypothetical protein
MLSLDRIHASAVTVSLLALGTLIATPNAARAVDLDELTVVTLAQDGSWGVATAASQGPAIAGAVRDCRAMAGGVSDCGAQFATTRGGWVVAKLCGDHKIIVAAETRQAAEQAALARELALKRLHVCTRVLTVGPHGVVLPTQAASAEEADGRQAAGPILVNSQTAASHPAGRFDAGTLTAESDFTAFMRKEVPEDLRRAALRRLWELMKLPAACNELCYAPEPPAPDLARLASEKLPVAAQ